MVWIGIFVNKKSFLGSMRQFPTVFWLLCLATTLFYASAHIFTTMLPIHLDGLHVPADDAGRLLALFLLVSVLVRPWVGKLYEEWNPKTLFVLGLGLFGLGTLAMLFSPHTLWVLWVARGLQGMGFSFFNSVSYSYLTEAVPQAFRARGIALFSNAIKLAMAYAPFIGWIMAARGLCVASMWISLLLLLLSFIVVLQMKMFSKRPSWDTLVRSENPEEALVLLRIPAKGRLFNEKGVTPGLLIASNSFVFGALIPFVPLIVASKGIHHVESFHLFYALALIASRFLGGEASDKYGRLYMVIPGMAVVVFSLVGMLYAHSTLIFLVSAVLYGLGSGVVQPSIVAMVADRTGVEERGSAMATYTMLADSGQGLGMLLMGYMGHHHTYTQGLELAFVLALAGLFLAMGLSTHESNQAKGLSRSVTNTLDA
jgi:MFS family permease